MGSEMCIRDRVTADDSAPLPGRLEDVEMTGSTAALLAGRAVAAHGAGVIWMESANPPYLPAIDHKSSVGSALSLWMRISSRTTKSLSNYCMMHQSFCKVSDLARWMRCGCAWMCCVSSIWILSRLICLLSESMGLRCDTMVWIR